MGRGGQQERHHKQQLVVGNTQLDALLIPAMHTESIAYRGKMRPWPF